MQKTVEKSLGYQAPKIDCKDYSSLRQITVMPITTRKHSATWWSICGTQIKEIFYVLSGFFMILKPPKSSISQFCDLKKINK